DARRGLRTGTYISGYPGSPLGGYDLALQRVKSLLEASDVVLQPGANEELAATAITGTQMLDQYPHSKFDGVIGIWYGKGPGVDRSGDAFKHGNFAGTSKHGAVVACLGEDHEGKSSTMPFQDDFAMVAHGIPILYPSSVSEFLSFGLHAIALSRFSGCWASLKLVNPLCDGGEMVDVSPVLIDGKPFRKKQDFTFFPGTNVLFEHHLYYERHAAVRAYGRANSLNRVEVRGGRDRLGIVTAGKTYADVRQALRDMGLDEDDLRRFGIRLLRIGLMYPLGAELVRDFATGLEQLIVVEEKRGFLETQIKEALYGLRDAPALVGKLDEQGKPLFPFQGGMDADLVAERLGPRLLAYAGEQGGIERRLAEIHAILGRQYEAYPLRTPNYCSGCPHNTGTLLNEGQIAWGSPGCHSFASLVEQPERRIEAMTQLGGEGLGWIGLSHFTDRPHLVQNVGDGSLFHSSYLNIRFAAATDTNMTFKILYNGYVANTGAQPMVGQKPVPDLMRLLAIEGVKKIALVSKEPQEYAGQELPDIAGVYPREQLHEAQAELEATPGTTILIYDETCANERRRQQKRGRASKRERYVVINEEVCEGCGDCGAKSNCMSLQRVETEFGQKTEVHQSSCNQDYFCLEGDCPSFITLEAPDMAGPAKPATPDLEADELPEPTRKVTLDMPYHIYTPGVGGTGVLTLNALLAFAAWMDGRRVLSYDQTGAAQKWGPVLSSIVIWSADQMAGVGSQVLGVGRDQPTPNSQYLGPPWSNKVGLGQCDLYLAADILGAVSPVNLDRCDPECTAAVVNTTLFPSGEMVRNVWFGVSTRAMQDSLRRFTRPESVYVEARALAEALFRDYMMTNIFLLGVAYQAGLLPLSAGSIEAAIRLNAVAVEENLQGFRYGRLWVHDPQRVRALLDPAPASAEYEQDRALAELKGGDAAAYRRLVSRTADLDEASRRKLAIRLAELIHYQDAAYAAQYLDFVLQVAAREGVLKGETGALTQAVAHHLYKLMAYKDEYEVARLHLKRAFHRRLDGLFPTRRSLTYHLHPPLLRSLGLKRKLELGEWFEPAFKALRAMRRLRGTPLDPFGCHPVRRQERELIGWYRRLVAEAPDYQSALDLAALPDLIRGYEKVKLANIERAKNQAHVILRSAATKDLGAAPSSDVSSQATRQGPSLRSG
ncbi:MAG TPA: indolepyruvate ferredoxin oxidoreductase family protein, partial [Chloroflexota bacterium]